MTALDEESENYITFKVKSKFNINDTVYFIERDWDGFPIVSCGKINEIQVSITKERQILRFGLKTDYDYYFTVSENETFSNKESALLKLYNSIKDRSKTQKVRGKIWEHLTNR